jgi:hypothetical protein
MHPVAGINQSLLVRTAEAALAAGTNACTRKGKKIKSS